MTVAQAQPWTWGPGACTMVPAWIWWVVSAAPAPQDTLACAVRGTSMSVAQVPATRPYTLKGASLVWVMLDGITGVRAEENWVKVKVAQLCPTLCIGTIPWRRK